MAGEVLKVKFTRPYERDDGATFPIGAKVVLPREIAQRLIAGGSAEAVGDEETKSADLIENEVNGDQ